MLPGESPLRVPLGRALREVERLDQTVSGALRIARAGSIALKVVELNIPLQRAIEVATPAFDRCGAALAQIGIGARPLPVRGDDAVLEQLCLNILLNAAQALGVDGKAGVTVVTEEGNVQVDIWDSGAGMAADQLEKVFDPFFSTKRDGTGLGLSVVRQIVNAHGGFISIDSAVDAGTTVSIRLSLVGSSRWGRAVRGTSRSRRRHGDYAACVGEAGEGVLFAHGLTMSRVPGKPHDRQRVSGTTLNR